MGRLLLEVWKEPALGWGAGGCSCAIRTPVASPSPEHRAPRHGRPSVSSPPPFPEWRVGGRLSSGVGNLGFTEGPRAWEKSHGRATPRGKKKMGVWDFAKLLGAGEQKAFLPPAC